MKCPHCEYEDGWSGKLLSVVNGEYGEFYFLSNYIKMVRKRTTNWQEKRLVGCPKCNMLFMSEEGYS
jgi:hypothetical protein